MVIPTTVLRRTPSSLLFYEYIYVKIFFPCFISRKYAVLDVFVSQQINIFFNIPSFFRVYEIFWAPVLFLHRINTTGVKIMPVLTQFMIFIQ